MNRDRWMILASALMFSFAALYNLRPGWLSPFARRGAIKPVPQSAVDEAVASETADRGRPEAVVHQREAIRADAPWGRNPFLTAEEEARALSGEGDDAQIRAIIMGRPRSVATVDGRFLVVGEKIGEETVAEIRPDAVVLEKEGRKRVLKTSQPAIAIEVKEGKE